VVTISGNVLTSSAPAGNQWYYEGTPIAGATGQTYTVTNNTGYYTCVVSLYGCSSPVSNQVWVVVTGQQELQAGNFNIFPVPNDGKFTVSMSSQSAETFSISVFNNIGAMVREVRDIAVNGRFDQVIDLRPVAAGMYTVVIRSNSGSQLIKKVVVKN
jgi:hypothetical protein